MCLSSFPREKGLSIFAFAKFCIIKTLNMYTFFFPITLNHNLAPYTSIFVYCVIFDKTKQQNYKTNTKQIPDCKLRAVEKGRCSEFISTCSD